MSQHEQHALMHAVEMASRYGQAKRRRNEAVAMARDAGVSGPKLAATLGVTVQTIYNWAAEVEQGESS